MVLGTHLLFGSLDPEGYPCAAAGMPVSINLDRVEVFGEPLNPDGSK